MIFHFKNKLSKIRQEAGLTQTQLAKALGVAQSTVNSWESGQRVPSVKSSQKISEFFNLPLEEIFAPYTEEVNLGHVSTSVSDKRNRDRLEKIKKIIDDYSFSEEELQDLEDYAKYLALKRNRAVHLLPPSTTTEDNDK